MSMYAQYIRILCMHVTIGMCTYVCMLLMASILLCVCTCISGCMCIFVHAVNFYWHVQSCSSALFGLEEGGCFNTHADA